MKKRQARKQTLGKKRGPKPPACGRDRLSINLTRDAWRVVRSMPGKSWTDKIESLVWRFDEIDNRRMISEGI